MAIKYAPPPDIVIAFDITVWCGMGARFIPYHFEINHQLRAAVAISSELCDVLHRIGFDL